jgi:beta-lactamase class A
MGFAIKDLSTGETFLLRPDTVFPQASSIKLTILLELMRQAQEGKLSLDEEHKVAHAETVGGSGVLFMMGDGTATMSLRDIATLMVVLSDNSATNIIIRRVGMENVNANNDRLGLKQTRLRRMMMDLAAAQRGDENVSTPREMMTLLEDARAGQALNPEFTKEYFRILELPKESEFHTALPESVTIADKPGALEAVRCDSGIIDIPGHPFILSVMTTYLKNDADGEAAIEQVTRLAYSYFDRLARSGAYGRIVSEK